MDKTTYKIEKNHTATIRFQLSSERSAEFSCVIKDIDYDRIYLIYPNNRASYAQYLHEGKEIEAVVYTDNGIFVFDSIVIDSPFEDDFVIELPEERKKIQRREYVRVSMALPLHLTRMGQVIKTNTINIGGGGIRFKTDKPLEKGDLWAFEFFVPKYHVPIRGYGEILYSTNQSASIVSVIKFLDIEETDRNKIIKLCFEKEANHLRSKTFMENDG